MDCHAWRKLFEKYQSLSSATCRSMGMRPSSVTSQIHFDLAENCTRQTKPFDLLATFAEEKLENKGLDPHCTRKYRSLSFHPLHTKQDRSRVSGIRSAENMKTERCGPEVLPSINLMSHLTSCFDSQGLSFGPLAIDFQKAGWMLSIVDIYCTRNEHVCEEKWTPAGLVAWYSITIFS